MFPRGRMCLLVDSLVCAGGDTVHYGAKQLASEHSVKHCVDQEGDCAYVRRTAYWGGLLFVDAANECLSLARTRVGCKLILQSSM